MSYLNFYLDILFPFIIYFPIGAYLLKCGIKILNKKYISYTKATGIVLLIIAIIIFLFQVGTVGLAYLLSGVFSIEDYHFQISSFLMIPISFFIQGLLIKLLLNIGFWKAMLISLVLSAVILLCYLVWFVLLLID